MIPGIGFGPSTPYTQVNFVHGKQPGEDGRELIRQAWRTGLLRSAGSARVCRRVMAMVELNETQQAVLDRIEAGRRGYVKRDDYAGQRCACDHLVYEASPGGWCRFCDCTDHRQTGRGDVVKRSHRRTAGNAAARTPNRPQSRR